MDLKEMLNDHHYPCDPEMAMALTQSSDSVLDLAAVRAAYEEARTARLRSCAAPAAASAASTSS